MHITLDEKGTVTVGTSYLASFSDEKPKGSFPKFTLSKSEYKNESTAPKSFTATVITCGETFSVFAKNVFVFDGFKKVSIEAVKNVKKLSAFHSPQSDFRFTADTMLCAFVAAKNLNIDKISVGLTFEDGDKSKSFFCDFDVSYLLKITESLIARALPFIISEKRFISAGVKNIESMPFPYSYIREGQSELIKTVYKCVKSGKRLIAEAPTGIGKTVSVLFPAVKSLGENVEKIFYLTAKNSTGKTALEAIRRMNKFAPEIRAVSITAKERICPVKDSVDKRKTKCRCGCPLSENIDGIPFSKRLRDAAAELLGSDEIFEKENVRAVAEEYAICPYELSLAVAEYCQVIVCDYNYIFDSKVRLKKLLDKKKHLLLIDEAHNLPDRTREAYSAPLSLPLFEEFEKTLSESVLSSAPLLTACKEVKAEISALKNECKDNERLTSQGVCGYGILNFVPTKLEKALSVFSKAAFAALQTSDDSEIASSVENMSSAARSFMKCAEEFDDGFVLFCEVKNGDVEAKISCLDPSPILNKYMNDAACTVAFSATLSPIDYFADIIGCKDAKILKLDSPYNADNLCLAAIDTVGTKLSQRRETADEVAEVILTAVTAKSGNYIVYCPSYGYMNVIVRAFLSAAPENVKAVAQKPGMSGEQEKRFLSFFQNSKAGETLVGFCVMGGSFSEGIDLPSDMLIGAILVGIGLPGLTSELNVLKEYFDKTREDGYNFAYLYPAITKILQAVGRVIRSEDDKGIAVLIDDRYRDPNIRKLFPAHWKNMHYIGDTYSLSKYLSDFWNKQ